MTTEERADALFQKVCEEQQSYREWLLNQSPEEILNHAYEYSAREDIVLEFQSVHSFGLSDDQLDGLLTSNAPLADIYKDYTKMKNGHMDMVRSCIKDRAEK